MLKVNVEDTIAASPAAVWELARDFGGVQRWSPEVTSCTVDGDGIGAVRTILMQGMTICERLESLDEGARKLSYSIVEGPLPLKNYLATIEVSAATGGHAAIRWSSSFEANGMTDEQAVQLVEMVYRQGIAGFKKALAG